MLESERKAGDVYNHGDSEFRTIARRSTGRVNRLPGIMRSNDVDFPRCELLRDPERALLRVM